MVDLSIATLNYQRAASWLIGFPILWAIIIPSKPGRIKSPLSQSINQGIFNGSDGYLLGIFHENHPCLAWNSTESVLARKASMRSLDPSTRETSTGHLRRWFFFGKYRYSVYMCNGKSPFFMGKSTISMAIFNCYE